MGSQYNGVLGNISPPVAVNITVSTNASPIQVTAPGHGLTTGDWVRVNNHQTNTHANGSFAVSVVDANNVLLVGSTGTAVGGATGTIQSLNFGSTYQIPSDGDTFDAAAFNVAYEALGDRTSFNTLAIGTYKYLDHFETLHDDASENTNWLGSTFTFASQNTWVSIVGIASPQAGILNGGDLIDCSFTFTVDWNATGGLFDGAGLMLGLGAGFSVAGVLPISSTKIAGSGQQVPGSKTTVTGPLSSIEGRAGMNLRGRFTVPPNVQTCELFLYGFTLSGGFAGISLQTPGDYAMIGNIWRPTFYANRIG